VTFFWKIQQIQRQEQSPPPGIEGQNFFRQIFQKNQRDRIDRRKALGKKLEKVA
jgi:hypothetical protein